MTDAADRARGAQVLFTLVACHGVHKPPCPAGRMGPGFKMMACTCGLDAVFKIVEELQREAKQ